MAIGKLTHAKIAKLNKKALLGDGGGLWLRARLLKDTSLSKRFCFRYRKRGIYAEIPIGPFPEVSLVDARLKASGYRAAIANGEDPAADRRAAERQSRLDCPRCDDLGQGFDLLETRVWADVASGVVET